MAHVSHIQDKKNINVLCPDGFANQLRFALAGVYLKLAGYVDSYNMEWTLNNHNNVDFLNYFLPLPKITFNKINREVVSNEDIIDTSSFKVVIECLTKKEDHVVWKEALDISLKYLFARPEIRDIVESYVDKHNIKNCIGVHVRRTCKTALIGTTKDAVRVKDYALSNEEILNVCKNYESVYLATDNEETQRWFKDRVGNKLITFTDIEAGQESFGGEYHRDLVKRHTTPLNTVMDFLILKECDTFLGTSESSLSLILKYWRNNKKDYSVFGRL